MGQDGEEQAVAWYQAGGYRLLDRNWRCRSGEIDLVCRRGGTVVFVEVKARTTDAFGIPAEAVTPAKQRRLRGLAAAWLRRHGVRCRTVRFDVVSVSPGALAVVEDAF